MPIHAPPPSAPPAGPPPGGPGGVQSKMSIFNPTDMAAKAAMGDVRPGQTVAEFLQKNFGVSPNDPIEKLVQATKGQLQNRTMAGKMGVPPQGRPSSPPPQPPMGGGMPPQRPPAAGPRPSGGLDDLVNRL